jgi:hypothetical protein
MYYDRHDPPHFHAIYGDNKAVIAIGDVAILEGDLPPRAVSLVMEWARSIRLRRRRGSVFRGHRSPISEQIQDPAAI